MNASVSETHLEFVTAVGGCGDELWIFEITCPFDRFFCFLISILLIFGPAILKIKGIVYANRRHGLCEFRVQLYRCSTAGQYMIEVQRRSGCMFAFRFIYGAIANVSKKSRMPPRSIPSLSSSITSAESTPATPRPLSPTFISSPSPPSDHVLATLVPVALRPTSSSSLASVPPAVFLTPRTDVVNDDDLLTTGAELGAELDALSKPTTDRSTIKCLVDMATSRAIEMVHEGVKALAVLSCESEIASSMCQIMTMDLKLDCYSLAATIIATAQPMTANAAAQWLANVCEASRDACVAAAACTKLVVALLTMLDAPSSLSTVSIKRESARALAAMAGSGSDMIAAFAQYDRLGTTCFTSADLLKRYAHSTDDTLREGVLSTLRLIGHARVT